MDLTPLGARALFGLPAGELGGRMVRHDELGHGVDAVLRERLEAAPGWRARFDLLDQRFLSILRRDHQPMHDGLSEAWRVLSDRCGAVRIADLATHIGWSRRRFATRFSDEFGVTPKQAARLMRFDSARGLVAAGATLADAAARAGYADQPHLTREWHGFAGLPPAEHLREDFPIVQDGTLAA